ncbi:hypothetical protein CASFOL_028842 [Castilleja foliolosa]|uniref:Uncharacterized protein n=1 Tax=Castilleja foliolosa TaxID=1961234 RepID=A0ABD3CCA1_9LAMI
MAGVNGKGKAVCGGLSALFMSPTSHEKKESKAVCGGLSALFNSSSSDHHKEKEEEEFQEEDMWDQPEIIRNPTVVWDYSTSVPKLIVPIPPSKREENLPKRPSSSRPDDEDSKGIDFPDWDKILGEEAPGKKQFWWDDEYDPDRFKNENKFSERRIYRPHGAKGDEDDDHLAPHEILSKRYYKNRAAYSMCEGAGRTLKGRDLRKFRNTVLFLTGYIETM